MKKSLWIGWLALLCVQAVCAGEWQWAVTLKGIVSEETHKEPEAFCGFLKMRTLVGGGMEPAEHDGRDFV